MKNCWSLSELSRILNVEYYGEDISFNRISIDTRKIRAGDCYLAIVGENFDGHDFIIQAITKGAACVISSKKILNNIPYLLVSNTRDALSNIAAYHRSNFHKPVIGLTGSCGKSTTKMLLTSILEQSGNVCSTPGNYNNDIGVPLSLLQLKNDHDFAVIEMGANHVGEIASLTNITRPSIALLLNAKQAHLDGFGSLDNIVTAKAEIFGSLDKDGIAILNADDKAYIKWKKIIQNKNKIISFGIHNTADIQATNIILNSHNSSFTLSIKGQQKIINLPLIGRHNIYNASAASACCYSLNISIDIIKDGIEMCKPVDGRLQVLSGNNGSIIINDSYNASPDSIKAAIDTLLSFSQRKLILVIADMGELGAYSEKLHREIGVYAKDKQINCIYALGDLAKFTCEEFGDNAHHYSSKIELVNVLQSLLDKDTAILIKASRVWKFEDIVAQLMSSKQEQI